MYQSESERLPTQAQLALQSGRRAEAVEIVRERTGLGQADARRLVERAERANQGDRLDVPHRAMGREDSGTLRLVATVAILGALAFAVLIGIGAVS